jgi:hypothetical protein
MPVEADDEVARLLVIVLCLDLRVHPSECNKEYCISLTLVRFITAMVLHLSGTALGVPINNGGTLT